MASLRSSLPFRAWRNRHTDPVWLNQQQRVRRAIYRAFQAPEPLALDERLDLDGAWPDADDLSPVMFAACDEGYFYRFGRHLALSSMVRSPATRVHLHLYAPKPECLAEAQALVERCGDRLTIGWEGPARNPFSAQPMSFYFAAGRFAVASRMRKTIAAPILMVDADSLVAKDLAGGFAELADQEAGFIRRPDKAALYRRILASAIYLGTGSRAVDEFFTRLADGIGIALTQAGPYHVDQIGIHYALQWCKAEGIGPQIHDLDLRWSDYQFRPESLIWSTKGARKDRYEQLLAQVEGGMFEPLD